jgi:predicted nucleotidyltransferase component of viral defense system
MRTLSAERIELIDALVSEANIGDITAGLLEKDEHLTAALQAVFGLSFEYASLVFCGGTSLSKAHGLIERMSEDADIKVVVSPDTVNWSKTQLRRHVQAPDRERFIEVVENQLLSLHEGNIACYRLRSSEFVSWRETWH